MHNPHIGLLGGSFNPPHNAHLALAQAARAQLGLARVDLMPAGQPWQKTGLTLAPAVHRLAMCRAVIEGRIGLGVEPCETLRSGNTYTVDTLRQLRAAHPNTRYTLIIGADQAQRLDTWHEWPALLGLCRLALVARNGQLATLPPAVRALCPSFDTIDLPALAIASSTLRAQLAAGQSVSAHLPAAVERYIVTHSLYQTL
jgi:nicotinate-nucleotide adenylyltransferase